MELGRPTLRFANEILQGFALAILVADAVAWEHAPISLGTGFLKDTPGGRELLGRAVVYRIVTTARQWHADSQRIAAEFAAYSSIVDLLRP